MDFIDDHNPCYLQPEYDLVSYFLPSSLLKGAVTFCAITFVSSLSILHVVSKFNIFCATLQFSVNIYFILRYYYILCQSLYSVA